MKRRRQVGARGVVVVVGALAITAGVGLPGGAASGSAERRAANDGGVLASPRAGPAGRDSAAGVWLMKITPGGKLVAYRPGTKSCGSSTRTPRPPSPSPGAA